MTGASPNVVSELAQALLAIDTVARSIVAQHLQTPLTHACWVKPDESARLAAQVLRGLDFDQAPVGRAGHLLGYVLTAELEAATGDDPVRGAIHALDAEHLVSANAGVLEVLEALHAGGPIAFVVDGREVTGFVTAPDLNKQPARTHFYLLLANLEAALAAWVRSSYSDSETALELLGVHAKKVRSRFRRDQLGNVEVDLVAGMDLGHLLAIVGSSERGQSRFGAPSFANWEEWAASLKSLRNAVMHPVLSLLGRRRTVAELIALEKGLREILARTSGGSQGERGSVTGWPADATGGPQ